ncbi:3-oxoacyl-[acyl-carrier-protein] reductase [Sodalis-like secondary symbiont of Drepanosiphum platanoidis]|uniref:3-oxoacyl-[acyl-carrier-protein] reductase n=1 Tax=Sodalis-like secondary symbiont of Drepanosiphum platanoidis TaxID=2994493 RepID=UPI003464BBDA
MNLKNKIALITGANKGIGLSIAKLFSKIGATVIGTSTTKIGVDLINKNLKCNGIGMKLNVTDTKSIQKFFLKINKKFEKIDILVNNAGIICDNLLIKMKEYEWQSVIDTNLTSVFRISKKVIFKMIKKKYGRIIIIGSVIGSIGNIGQSNYSASKAGIIGLMKSLSLEVASKGITVNLVSPGFIITDMTKKLKNEYKDKILSKIPLNRFGTPKDIANAVAFLASDKSEYITGTTLHVNGGIYMS